MMLAARFKTPAFHFLFSSTDSPYFLVFIFATNFPLADWRYFETAVCALALPPAVSRYFLVAIFATALPLADWLYFEAAALALALPEAF